MGDAQAALARHLRALGSRTTTGSTSTSSPFEVSAFGCSLTSTTTEPHQLVELRRGQPDAARDGRHRVEQVARPRRSASSPSPARGLAHLRFSARVRESSRTSRTATAHSASCSSSRTLTSTPSARAHGVERALELVGGSPAGSGDLEHQHVERRRPPSSPASRVLRSVMLHPRSGQRRGRGVDDAGVVGAVDGDEVRWARRSPRPDLRRPRATRERLELQLGRGGVEVGCAARPRSMLVGRRHAPASS